MASLQAGSHGDDVLRQPRYFERCEGAQFRVEVKHPPVTLPQLTEHASGTCRGERDSDNYSQMTRGEKNVRNKLNDAPDSEYRCVLVLIVQSYVIRERSTIWHRYI